MLTIQPKFTPYSQNNLTFKSSDIAILNDVEYENKVKYYENQTKEFDNLIEDKHTPDALKKVLAGSKIVSEGLLEGWAVAWGASKGAKVMKSSFMKGINSKFAKKVGELSKPIATGIKNGASRLWKAVSNVIDNIKVSEFMTNMTKRFSAIRETLNNNAFGKYIVQAFDQIGKGLKWTKTKIATAYNNITTTAKNLKGDEVYDKISNVASKTLGVGAGAAGAYNAATKASDRAEAKANAKIENAQFEDFTDDEISMLDNIEIDIEDGE